MDMLPKKLATLEKIIKKMKQGPIIEKMLLIKNTRKINSSRKEENYKMNLIIEKIILLLSKTKDNKIGLKMKMQNFYKKLNLNIKLKLLLSNKKMTI